MFHFTFLRSSFLSRSFRGRVVVNGLAAAILIGITFTLTTAGADAAGFSFFDSVGAFFGVQTHKAPDKTGASAPNTASTNIGDVAVNVGNTSIKKLSAVDGTILWSNSVAVDVALAVDQVDLGVYTGNGSHSFGGNGTVYKYDNSGVLAWTNTISVSGICNFYYVGFAAVDTTSVSPGVVWTQTGCYGGIAKTSRTTGAQQWSVFTNDIGRASIDNANGQIYDITNAGSYNTIYSATTGGALSSAASCQGPTDLNPADGNLYRACGTTLSRMDKSTLGATIWNLNLSATVSSIDTIGVQPWTGGYIYLGSVSSNKIVVVNPATQTVVTSFTPAVAPGIIAVNPTGGNVYLTDGTGSSFVYAYSPTGALVWTSPNFGGTVYNIAAPKGIVGTPPPLNPAVGNVVVDVGDTSLVRLNAATGTILWGPVARSNCNGLAVDQVDLGVYTASSPNCIGGGPAAVYRYDVNGVLSWNTGYGGCGGGGNYYVGNGGIAVDTTSSIPGVVLGKTGFFGEIGKVNRASGATIFCSPTNDVGRPTIDITNGQIFDTTVAGPGLGYNTIYRSTNNGVVSSSASCEGYTDLNPGDGMLYRGGNMASNGCGLTLSQVNKVSLTPTWNMTVPGIATFDSLAVQPWVGGYIYVGSATSFRIVVVNPATQTVVTSFPTAIAPNIMAVNPNGGNVFIADSSSGLVFAYSPTGALFWVSPNLGGPIYNLATPRDLVGAPALPTAAGVSISGRVLTADGSGLRNAVVDLTDRNGTVQATRTSSFGYYRFENVTAGETYIVSVSSKRFTFAPRVVTVSDDIADLDFTAEQER